MPQAQLPSSSQSFNASWSNNPVLHVRRVFLEFIGGLFATAPSGCYHWDPSNPEGSEIYLSDDTPIAVERVGARPAITVMRGPADFKGLGIGDMAYRDLATGAVAKMDMISTTVIINVLSRIPIESENLAWMINEHIWLYREEFIRSQPGLLYTGAKGRISQVTPAGSLVRGDTEHNWVVCSIFLPVYLQHMAAKYPLGDGRTKGFITGIDGTIKVAEVVTPTTPVLVLQGSAVAQPLGSGGELPQNQENEAQSSSEPLDVTIVVEDR